jgi:hypothetical protein
MLFPINRKSTRKEPAHWRGQLAQQGIPSTVLGALSADVADRFTSTLRAKRAVSCLYYIAGTPMSTIEEQMLQFGGGFNASGPIVAVADRTADVLGTAARVAAILHPGLDLADRSDRLLVRLSLGVPGGVVDIARHARGALTRSDYMALHSEGLGSREAAMASDDAQLLSALGNDPTKVTTVRRAARLEVERQAVLTITPIALPAYES